MRRDKLNAEVYFQVRNVQSFTQHSIIRGMEKTEDRFARDTGRQMKRHIGAVSHATVPGMMTPLVGSLMQIANTGGRRGRRVKREVIRRLLDRLSLKCL